MIPAVVTVASDALSANQFVMDFLVRRGFEDPKILRYEGFYSAGNPVACLRIYFGHTHNDNDYVIVDPGIPSFVIWFNGDKRWLASNESSQQFACLKDEVFQRE